MDSPGGQTWKTWGKAGDVKPALMNPAIFFSSCFSSDFFSFSCGFAKLHSQDHQLTQTGQHHRYVGWRFRGQLAAPNDADASCSCLVTVGSNRCIKNTVHKNTVYGSWHLLPLPHEQPDKSSGTAQVACQLIQWTRIWHRKRSPWVIQATLRTDIMSHLLDTRSRRRQWFSLSLSVECPALTSPSQTAIPNSRSVLKTGILWHWKTRSMLKWTLPFKANITLGFLCKLIWPHSRCSFWKMMHVRTQCSFALLGPAASQVEFVPPLPVRAWGSFSC